MDVALPTVADTAAQNPVLQYWVDAWQRSILLLDTLRERGNEFEARKGHLAQHVLHFPFEIIMDGRTLPHPVNYGLIRILPTAEAPTDPAKPPFIVVDPRAGHGPGIGGMKAESEIGVALAAGHPCYFIGFLPAPVSGQTVEHVCEAEARFVEEVARRHPQAEGKPVIIANCQAGWQIMIMAAMRPDLPGPIMLAGSPLSYWAGVRGKNPMRYLGGVLGGSWLTALFGDLGNGIFDGANLVANFESLNLANTYWQKAYNVYSKVDSEVARFLEFEAWWGSPVLMNAKEMQWIVDNLFVGNKLATGHLDTSDGTRLDLRNIKSPIVVFCSRGDNITPPQQALDWITDLYREDSEIVANGQTIVYCLHHSIGHLGIFVSGKVAEKEHDQFASSMDMIDLLPPGLYEAVFTPVDASTTHPMLVHGQYVMSLEARTLNDIRAIGDNDEEDDRRFATVARLSEINLGLYETLAAPVVRSFVTEQTAEAMRSTHPNRLRFATFSDLNPFMAPIASLAAQVRDSRQPAAADNPLLGIERTMSSCIASALSMAGEMRDMMTETFFLNFYGSPIVQAMVGLGAGQPVPLHAERDLLRDLAVRRARSEAEKHFEVGRTEEAFVRALIYIRSPERSVDERGFAIARQVRAARPASARLPWARLKEIFHEQFLLVSLDEERAIRAIPEMVPNDPAERREMVTALRQIAEASGPLSEVVQARLQRIENLLGEPVAKKPAAQRQAAEGA
jgi:pimeloyl-ACP methyl ester carboxylesterase